MVVTPETAKLAFTFRRAAKQVSQVGQARHHVKDSLRHDEHEDHTGIVVTEPG